MSNWKNVLGTIAAVAALGTVGTWMEKDSGPATLKAQPPFTLPVPLPVTGTVNVGNFPATQNVHVTNNPLTVNFSHPTLVSDATFFNVTMNGQPTGSPPEPTLMVPAGVVLTDAHATLSVPQQIPDAAELFVSQGGKTYYYRVISHTNYESGFSLQSGIVSDGTMRVTMSCINIANNSCQGALMWSGYQQQ